ncbi:MAG: hypothetical protein Q9196_001357 [Gyalolechia fulgens]
MIHSSFAFLSYCCILSTSFLTVTRAADHPPANYVTWLYPADSTDVLTFNTLDVVNVSWISAYAPTFLDLACHNSSGGYSSALKIQVPATGNRLVSLHPAASYTATYQRCRFEISAPDNFSHISQSPSFHLQVQEDRDPVLWTPDADAQQGSRINHPDDDESSSSPGSQHQHATRHVQAMIGIGVGVAVGVFAITALAYTLFVIAARKAELRRETKGPSTGRESMTKNWVLESALSGSQPGQEGGAGGKGQVAEGWVEKQTRDGHISDIRRRSRAEP